jgi:hypothetical protein
VFKLVNDNPISCFGTDCGLIKNIYKKFTSKPTVAFRISLLVQKTITRNKSDKKILSNVRASQLLPLGLLRVPKNSKNIHQMFE